MAAPSQSASEEKRLAACLERLAAGDASARDELIAIACERMRGIAHRMLRSFPTVRRWDETDDVVQNAAMRLVRALNQITPRDPRGFIGLAAVQIRRELLDLARIDDTRRGGLDQRIACPARDLHDVALQIARDAAQRLGNGDALEEVLRRSGDSKIGRAHV